MLRLPFFLAACSLILTVGCSTNSALVPEYMTVSPHLLTYQTADNVHTVALTHSCTCPITWTITKSDSEKWVKVTPSAITIDRSLLTRDTSIAYLYVTTNEYKTQSGNLFDTVMIKAIR
jgi:hypothetical protein